MNTETFEEMFWLARGNHQFEEDIQYRPILDATQLRSPLPSDWILPPLPPLPRFCYIDARIPPKRRIYTKKRKLAYNYPRHPAPTPKRYHPFSRRHPVPPDFKRHHLTGHMVLTPFRLLSRIVSRIERKGFIRLCPGVWQNTNVDAPCQVVSFHKHTRDTTCYWVMTFRKGP